jgi:hypothetical protein
VGEVDQQDESERDTGRSERPGIDLEPVADPPVDRFEAFPDPSGAGADRVGLVANAS